MPCGNNTNVCTNDFIIEHYSSKKSLKYSSQFHQGTDVSGKQGQALFASTVPMIICAKWGIVCTNVCKQPFVGMFELFPHGTVHLLCVNVMTWNYQCWLTDSAVKNSSLIHALR